MELKRYKLGEIGEIRMCKRILKEETNSVGGVPFFKIGTFGGQADVFITKEKFEEYKNAYSYPKKGDVLISAAGTIGRTVVFDGKDAYFQDSNIVWIENDESKVLNEYLFYCYKNIRWTTSVGSTILRLYNDDIRNTDIIVPPLSEQKKIASVLSTLDDKIALNKKMNQKLEAMAKRLYDYWFVQYDFPDKNGHPYKTTGGPMTYNPTLKREIPTGWEVVDINELCQVVDCLHSKKPDYCYEDENSYLLALENITKEGYIDLSDKYYISKKDFAEWTSRICVKENDFLFTNAGRAGDMGMVPEGVLCAIGRNITAVRPEKINPWYLRCFFKSLYMQEQILNNLDQGSFFMSFNVRSIKKLQVLMPSEPLMKKFVSFIEPHLKRIEKNNKEISRLKKLRDKLLPLLMNGQVVVG
ncbi:restriction endonuclease subunit S [Fibrobacter sp.]